MLHLALQHCVARMVVVCILHGAYRYYIYINFLYIYKYFFICASDYIRVIGVAGFFNV